MPKRKLLGLLSAILLAAAVVVAMRKRVSGTDEDVWQRANDEPDETPDPH